MCGFAGFLGYGSLAAERAPVTAKAMGAVIRHRGPDDADVWHDAAGRIALVHQRLAIVDVSPAGRQPMQSASGRYVIAFNGEIYNHLALRRELDASLVVTGGWRGHSDTETLLAAIDQWGLDATLARAEGMFALALWDRDRRELHLARDRVGEKPLYFGWQGHGQQRVFLFGSELSALKAHPAFSAPIDRGAVALLMRHNYVPAPFSIYEGIAKLQPGHVLRVSWIAQAPEIRCYWDFLAVARSGQQDRFDGSPREAVDALDGLLRRSIGQQMVADVPLGAFLSGGIDSSTVVALMQAQSSRPVKTYTIGFHEAGYNEAVHAKAVAQHLGTEHTELYVTPQQAMAVIPRLPHLYSEPFADSSQVPTYLVSELARGQVTVALSGDAGDELFCGYNRYCLTADRWSSISRLPRPLRRVAAAAVAAVPPGAWQTLGSVLHVNRLGERLDKAAALLVSQSTDELYYRAVSHWSNPCELVLGATEPETLLTRTVGQLQGLGGVERMMALDTLTYLPDDLLTKVDRAAMGVSLETRVPFLDHRVIEFAWRLPMDYKLRSGVTKWPLRQILYRYVPQSLVDRPKMGFAVPVDTWLRGPLREWAEALLSESRLRSEGFLDPQTVRAQWEAHVRGRLNGQARLWPVLMFQAWLENESGRI